MNYESYARRTLAKLQSANELYAKWMLKRVAHVNQVDALQTREHLRQPPETGWQPMDSGAAWGGEWNNLWIRATVKIPEGSGGQTRISAPGYRRGGNAAFFAWHALRHHQQQKPFSGRGTQRGISHGRALGRAKNFRSRLSAMRGTIARARSPYENHGCDEPAEGAFAHAFRGLDVLVLDEAVHQMCFDLMEIVLQAA